jgi:hypothetical protein
LIATCWQRNKGNQDTHCQIDVLLMEMMMVLLKQHCSCLLPQDMHPLIACHSSSARPS